MMRSISVAAAVLLALGRAVDTVAPTRPVPILVELFTSEGCSSCPPADVLLQKLSDSQPNIIALGEHVDYWDQQGWKDRFSSASLTNRQQVYGARFSVESVYTPQMVVDGRSEFVGSDAGAARRALERAAAVPHGRVELAGELGSGSMLRVTMTASELPKISRPDRVDLAVAVTEDGLVSNVTRGENHGRVLAHTAVVRHLSTIGEAAADGPTTVNAEIPIGADWQRTRLKLVGFVQERRGRAILASAVTQIAQR